MHRLIMTSTVYRQSSRREPAKDAVDPDNALLRPLPGAAARRRGAPRPHPARQRPARPHACSARPCRWPRTPSARCCPANDSPRREPLSPGPPHQAGLAPGGLRRSGHGGQLRPPRPEHVGAAVADAHEQRLRPEAGRRHCPARPRRDAPARGSAGSALPSAWQLAYQRPITPDELSLASRVRRRATSRRSSTKAPSGDQRARRADEPLPATPRLQRVPLCGLIIVTRPAGPFWRTRPSASGLSPWPTCCARRGCWPTRRRSRARTCR